MLVLVWYARTSIPMSWRYVCATSIFSPLVGLCNRDKLRFELALHHMLPMDSLRGLFFEGVCEDFLSLSLGLYYAFEVTSVGLSDADVISLLLSGCAVIARCGDMVLGVWFYFFPAQPVQTEAAASVERNRKASVGGIQLVPVGQQTSDDV